MEERTDLTFGILIVAVTISAAVFVWAEQQGKFHVFGDTVGVPVRTNRVQAAPDRTVVQESFETDQFQDVASTTALWNFEAGELQLPAGAQSALAQSKTVVIFTGKRVSVTLTSRETRPATAQIYYSVSADGGVNWTTIDSTTPHVFDQPEGDWRFRIFLDRGQASISPSVQAINLLFTPAA